MKHTATYRRLRDLAEEIGLSVEVSYAHTGSVYMTVSRFGAIDRNSFQIRFADHGDAYGRAGYTCDDLEGTAKGARAFMLEKAGTSEKAVRRLRRARRSAEHRELAETHENWVRGYATQRGVSIEEAVAASPFRHKLPARFLKVTA